MTPYELGILLHVYGSTAPPPVDRGRPLYLSTVTAFEQAGLVTMAEDGGFRATPRLHAFVEYLMHVQLPEQRWVMPSNQP